MIFLHFWFGVQVPNQELERERVDFWTDRPCWILYISGLTEVPIFQVNVKVWLLQRIFPPLFCLGKSLLTSVTSNNHLTESQVYTMLLTFSPFTSLLLRNCLTRGTFTVYCMMGNREGEILYKKHWEEDYHRMETTHMLASWADHVRSGAGMKKNSKPRVRVSSYS